MKVYIGFVWEEHETPEVVCVKNKKSDAEKATSEHSARMQMLDIFGTKHYSKVEAWEVE